MDTLKLCGSVSAQPFPHIVIDDFLGQDVIASLLKTMTPENAHFHHKGWGGNRTSAQFGTREYQELLDSEPSCRALHEALVSPNFVSHIFGLFQSHLEECGLDRRYLDFSRINYRQKKTEFVLTSSLIRKAYIKFFYNPVLRKLRLRKYVRSAVLSFAGPSLHPLVSYSISKGGYVEGIHTDARQKIFVGLIYLDDVEVGGQLRLHSLHEPKNLISCKQYPTEAELKTVLTVTPRRNRLVLFLNANNAYHSTTPFDGLRRFIYFSFAASFRESVFDTDYPVELGDASPSELL